MRLPTESLNNGSVPIGGVQHMPKKQSVLAHCDIFSFAHSMA